MNRIVSVKLYKNRYNTYISIVWIACFAIFSSILREIGISDKIPEIMVVLWITAGTIFLYYFSIEILLSKNDKILFWISYFFRITYAIYKYGISDLSEPSLNADAAGFWNVANQYYIGDYHTVYTVFPYILNFEFKIFGINILCCIFINIILTMIMIRVVFSLFNKLNIKGNIRLISGLIICFLPYSFQVTTNLWRESLYFCFLTLSLNFYIEYIYNKKQKYFYIALLSLIPVLICHIGYFPIVVVYFIDMLKYSRINNKKELLNKIIQIILIITFIYISSNFNSIGYITGSNDFSIEGIVDKLSGSITNESVNTAGSRYLEGVDIDSVPSFILYSLLKWFYYLTSPLPMDWRSVYDVIAFLFDGLIQFFIVYEGIKCILYLKKYKNTYISEDLRIIKISFWSFVLCAFVFGLGTSTAGTAMRHREVMIGIGIIVIALSMKLKLLIK